MIENISFDGAFELFLAFHLSFGIYLLVRAAVSVVVGAHNVRAAVLLTLAGLTIVVAALVTRISEIQGIFSGIDGLSNAISVIALAGIAIFAIGLANLAIEKVAPVVERLVLKASRRPVREWSVRASTIGLPVVLGISVLVSLSVIIAVEPQDEADPEEAAVVKFTVEASHDLPDDLGVLSMALLDNFSGYIALGGGIGHGEGIFRFDLQDGVNGKLELRSVYPDISNPRGMEILDGELFVSTSNSVPCNKDYTICNGENQLLPRGTGAVYVFTINPDGSLSNPRPVLTDLPIMNVFHQVNGIVAGDDGFLYVSIGSAGLSVLEGLDPVLRSKAGTVIRIDPDTYEYEIFASGLRNVYELAFDNDGNLWGVDNDGATERGFRGEEVLQIVAGGDYGFPFGGSFDSPPRRQSPPIWVGGIPNGATGLDWAVDAGLAPGLLIGTLQVVQYLPISRDENGPYVVHQQPVSLLTIRSGYFSALETAPNGLLYVGTIGGRKKGQLTIIRFADDTAPLPPSIQ